MRIGLISDIHGNSPALKAVIGRLMADTNQILFLGDLCGYYPFVNECVALWDSEYIVGVRGNHDQILLDCIKSQIQPSLEYDSHYGSALRRSLGSLSWETQRFLEALPLSRLLTVCGSTLALYHGAPWDPLEGRVYPDYKEWDRFSDVAGDVVLLGHTHYPFVKYHKGKLIVNPGSVGQPRDHSAGACYAELNLNSGEVRYHRVTYHKSLIIDDARLHDPHKPYLVEVLTR